ncbi:hypothetical protein [Paenibacillus larvae]|uniref:hypothetical protein n=1 Tax=Paenibacillus larvae TaxID=1464 RepID=UPI000983E1B4|nr:hypothetical protein [Paenibacillus larvae]AQR79182.1 hypothetical protein BXP28_20090 [Paenibacillus larvae subsp. larvae]MDT2280689.1 hypothetical protein [Paenibacillus larvae]MDT2292489.1 hypothetical protein [Paenibacillus larvae]MDT2311054.1 hypothetical protein [Paenibacillus larvae]
MFEMLICQKNKVKVACGADIMVGIISSYYEQFQLIKVNNVLLPIEHIHWIEVLDEDLECTPMNNPPFQTCARLVNCLPPYNLVNQERTGKPASPR